MPLSIVTIGSLQDMGYNVDYAAADAYRLPGHLVAGGRKPFDASEMTGQSASAYRQRRTGGHRQRVRAAVLANDEVGNGGFGNSQGSVTPDKLRRLHVRDAARAGARWCAVDAARWRPVPEVS